VKNAFISNGLSGAFLTDAAGAFELDLPRGSEFTLRVSRTGFTIAPPAVNGEADADESLGFAATPLINAAATKRCKTRELAPAKLKIYRAFLSASPAGDARSAVVVESALGAVLGLPETAAICRAAKDCKKADWSGILKRISRAIGRLQAVTSREPRAGASKAAAAQLRSLKRLVASYPKTGMRCR
jgi:hypothetical protein